MIKSFSHNNKIITPKEAAKEIIQDVLEDLYTWDVDTVWGQEQSPGLTIREHELINDQVNKLRKRIKKIIKPRH